jgi:hypothetical protein
MTKDCLDWYASGLYKLTWLRIVSGLVWQWILVISVGDNIFLLD